LLRWWLLGGDGGRLGVATGNGSHLNRGGESTPCKGDARRRGGISPSPGLRPPSPHRGEGRRARPPDTPEARGLQALLARVRGVAPDPRMDVPQWIDGSPSFAASAARSRAPSVLVIPACRRGPFLGRIPWACSPA